MGRLDDKVVVVTGGGSGIGQAITLGFLREGARVVVADRNPEASQATLAQAHAEGCRGRIEVVTADVSCEADVARTVAAARTQFGTVDVFLNNAGVLGKNPPIWDAKLDEWDHAFGVMAKGTFLGIKHAARAMREGGKEGVIINTASIAALSGGGAPLIYSAAKATVVSLTRSAAVELASLRIRVNAICPGGILTPMIDRGNPTATSEQLSKLQPWPEHGKPEDVAAAALFLASDEARFITGEVLVVDGGLTAAGPNIWRLPQSARSGVF